MYLFDESFARDDLSKEGTVVASKLGTSFKLSTEPESLYTNDMTVKVDIMYFINKRGSYFDTYEATQNGTVPTNEQDTRIKVQTSNIRTKTGVVHVLTNTHTLFFHVPTAKK